MSYEWNEFFQFVILHGFFPLSIQFLLIISSSKEGYTHITKKYLFELLSSLNTSDVTKSLIDSIFNTYANQSDHLSLLEVSNLIDENPELFYPLYHFRMCIRNNIFGPYITQNIIYRNENIDEIKSYLVNNKKYPGNSCMLNFKCKLYHMPNPYIFDYSPPPDTDNINFMKQIIYDGVLATRKFSAKSPVLSEITNRGAIMSGPSYAIRRKNNYITHSKSYNNHSKLSPTYALKTRTTHNRSSSDNIYYKSSPLKESSRINNENISSPSSIILSSRNSLFKSVNLIYPVTEEE